MGFLADLFKPKQPEEGLLSGGQNQNPDFNKLIGLSLLTRVTGGANSPYANLIPMMSQMQQAKRQQDLMDLEHQRFGLEQEKFGLTKQQTMAQQENLQDFSKSVLNPPAPPTTYGYGYSTTDPNAQAQIPSIPSKEAMTNAQKRVYAANLVRTGEVPNMKLAMDMLGFGESKTLSDGQMLVSSTGEPIAANTLQKNSKLFEQSTKLRDEFTKQAKDFPQVSDAFGRIQVSAKNPSAAGDLSLIFNYMKMLDPGSTVREGEQASAQNTAGVPDQIRNMYNKLLTGERLAPKQREDFVNRAYGLYSEQLKGLQQLEKDYTDRANRYGLNPKDVLVDYRVPGRFNQSSQEQPQYTPEQLRSLAGKAIKDGKDPAAVMERLKSLTGN